MCVCVCVCVCAWDTETFFYSFRPLLPLNASPLSFLLLSSTFFKAFHSLCWPEVEWWFLIFSFTACWRFVLALNALLGCVLQFILTMNFNSNLEVTTLSRSHSEQDIRGHTHSCSLSINKSSPCLFKWSNCYGVLLFSAFKLWCMQKPHALLGQ